MPNNTIEHLVWDSQFFGYSVARIMMDETGFDKTDRLLRLLALEKVRLTYFFVPVSDVNLNTLISERGGLLVDQKTTYSKKTEKLELAHPCISEFQDTEINDRLIDLGLQAGLFSRFRVDDNFANNEYERLYIEWLTKSINKSIALKTFIAKQDSEIVGITTLGGRSEFAEIGLVAVDENYRGRGIASNLVHFAERTAFDLGYPELKVVTQLQNKGACRLYEKCNFNIESITNVYHYWQ